MNRVTGTRLSHILVLAILGGCPHLIVNTRLIAIDRFLKAARFGFWIAPSEEQVPNGGPLKKLLLLAALIVIAAPFNASAQFKHRHIRASEMAGMGVGAAALVGVAGYFLLRRRHDS